MEATINTNKSCMINKTTPVSNFRQYINVHPPRFWGEKGKAADRRLFFADNGMHLKRDVIEVKSG
ncbi:hypothetical protein [Paenibacillus caseinilyticus]|uniref:hypothetical protein n=1 Tax=Paenibacillus caseinilyticus TaxID=3098138 RepID=UPI0022B9399E|nr:hypothetical protein [Paenibacillus caseinilyticus]